MAYSGVNAKDANTYSQDITNIEAMIDSFAVEATQPTDQS
jgi:hypothetical protein